MSQTCVGWLQTDLLTTTLYGVKGKCSWDDIWNNIVMALKQQKEYYDQKRTKQKEYYDQKCTKQKEYFDPKRTKSVVNLTLFNWQWYIAHIV